MVGRFCQHHEARCVLRSGVIPCRSADVQLLRRALIQHLAALAEDYILEVYDPAHLQPPPVSQLSTIPLAMSAHNNNVGRSIGIALFHAPPDMPHGPGSRKALRQSKSSPLSEATAGASRPWTEIAQNGFGGTGPCERAVKTPAWRPEHSPCNASAHNGGQKPCSHTQRAGRSKLRPILAEHKGAVRRQPACVRSLRRRHAWWHRDPGTNPVLVRQEPRRTLATADSEKKSWTSSSWRTWRCKTWQRRADWIARTPTSTFVQWTTPCRRVPPCNWTRLPSRRVA